MLIDSPTTITIAHPAVYYAMPIVSHLQSRMDVSLTALAPAELDGDRGMLRYGCMLLPPAALLHHGPFRLLPGIGVVADGEAVSERLVSDEPLDRIKHIAVHPDAGHLVPILSLLFHEQGLPLPSYSPASEDGTAAVLLSGDAGWARRDEPGHDLGALWRNVVDLPLVLGVWACGPVAPYRKLRMVIGEAARDAVTPEPVNHPAKGALHYRLLSAEADSLRALHGLAVKHGLTEASEEAIVFC